MAAHGSTARAYRRRVRTTRRFRVLVALAGGLLMLAAGCSSGGGQPDNDAAGEGFPVTITHEFGETTIPAEPTRVVTVGFNGQDFALALGVQPVGVREYLGYDAPARPWAQELLPAEPIPTVGSQEIDLERVAILQPDLILAINGYLDQDSYDKLSKIAPTVAQSADYAQGNTPWEKQLRTTARALGKPEAAEPLIADTDAAFDEAVARHPEFQGLSAAFAMFQDGAYSLGADDYRTQWLTRLGFTVPDTSGKVSAERYDLLDTDVLVAEGDTRSLDGSALYQGLPVAREGRTVELGGFADDFAGALGFNSPLSLRYVLDVAVPRLAAAVDGDPGTAVAPYPGG